MSYTKQIGKKILDTMQSKNISVVTLSKESGYSVKDLYRLVNGNLILPPNGLERIADAEEIKKLILDVQGEIHDITQYQLNKIATNYDMVYITEEQDKII